MAQAWREELVYATTEDHVQLAGAVISPATAPPHAASIVWIHGNAAAFYDQPYVVIGRELATLGYTVLLSNTRGHDIAATLWKADDNSPMAGGGGSAWELMEDAPLDLAAWVGLAATRTPGAVLLAGHSKGAQKVVLYTAGHPSPHLLGIALISPDLYGLRLPGELDAARALVAEGRGMEVLPAQPWAPWYRQSARTVVSGAEVADHLLTSDHGPSRMASVSVPILATFGTLERNAEASLATIRAAATAAPHVETQIVTDANHFYTGTEAALATVVAGWASAILPASGA